MGIKIGLVNADTNVKLGSTIIQSGYIGFNQFYNTYTSILDLYPTSVHHAYSLRKLKSTYTGFGLRVRRTATTSTEVNVGFDVFNTISLNSPITYVSGTATTAKTLGEFSASTGYSNPDGVTANQSIYVVTWIDQSGNGKNPTIGTAGNQPRLVNAGVLETSGGKVAVRFVKASSNVLQLTDTSANINNMSSYFVGAFVTTVAVNVGYGLSGSSTNRFYFPYSNGTNTFAGYGGNPGAVTLETGVNTNRKLFELLSPTTGSTTLAQGWTNGVAKNTVALASGASVQIQLGTAGSNYYDGYIQEVIGWQSNANRVEKETNINDFWQVY